MKKLLVKTTYEYNHADGYYTAAGNIHSRINHKAEYPNGNVHILNVGTKHRDLYTKKDKLEDYVCRCIENDVRPFHYTDSQWKEVQNDLKNEYHTDRCEANNAYLYEY